MKNIVLLINQLHLGGAEKVVSGLSAELSKKYNVFLITFNKTDEMFPYKGQHLFIDLPFSDKPSENNVFARLARLVILIFKIRRLKKSKNIHASISFLEASNIVNILSRRKDKVIVSVRSHLSSEFKDDSRLKVFRLLIRTLYNRASAVVAASKLIKKDLQDNFSLRENKIAVIYNSIDQGHIGELAKENIASDFEKGIFRDPVLINVGRITSAKAQYMLLAILKKIKDTKPRVKLIIIGDGPLKKELVQAAKELGIRLYDSFSGDSHHEEYDAYLLGFKSNPYPYLSKSVMMVSGSLYEGFPNVLVEAMACGLPIVSSDCSSGPREILAPGTDINNIAVAAEYAEYGILLPVLAKGSNTLEKDTGTWAQTIADLLSNDVMRATYTTKAALRAENFNKTAIIQEWYNLIED